MLGNYMKTQHPLLGIHHITALASDPQRNIDFYCGVLGMRLVKKTVNFDEPGVYHFYYGDSVGSPGSLLTFFPFPHAGSGKDGTGVASSVAFAIPLNAAGFWIDRFSRLGVAFDGPAARNGEEVLSLRDPDGMKIDLVPLDEQPSPAQWQEGSVGPDHALLRIRGVSMTVKDPEPSATFLSGLLGFGARGNRFTSAEGNATVDLIGRKDALPARMSAGSIHHVAWRVKSNEDQREWRTRIEAAGTPITPVVDRQYFHSVYFHEPGGVLFEIATEPPGFLIDEPKESLGESLRLPGWLEPRRPILERMLPPVTIPRAELPVR